MTIPTSNLARRRRSPRQISILDASARVLAALLLIPITAFWGVATVVLLEATRRVLWFMVFEATEPPNIAVPLLTSDRYWIRTTAWLWSVSYGDMYVFIIVFIRNMWNTRAPGLFGFVAMGHFICALWIFTLVLQYRARRLGLRTFSNQPSRAWLPTLKDTGRCLGHMCLCQTALVVFFLSATKVLTLCFYIGFVFKTQETPLWPETWHTSIMSKFGDFAKMLPRIDNIFAIAIGIVYSLLACNRLSRDVVRAEYRRTVSHCRRCGYPIARGGATCPECGPTVPPRLRGSRVDAALKWVSRPPKLAFLQITGMVLLAMGIEGAFFPGLHRIYVFTSPGRPRPPLNQIQYNMYATKLLRNFDYIAPLRLDTAYSINVDGADVILQVHAPSGQAHYTQSLHVTWTVDGSPVQIALFPGYDPMRQIGGYQTEWERFPAIFINDNVFVFQIGVYIVLEPGPDRVDVRIFADSVSIDLAKPLQ